MLVTGFPAAAFATNCYVVAPAVGEECLVVDPGIGVLDQLADVLARHRRRPAAVPRLTQARRRLASRRRRRILPAIPIRRGA